MGNYYLERAQVLECSKILWTVLSESLSDVSLRDCGVKIVVCMIIAVDYLLLKTRL